MHLIASARIGTATAIPHSMTAANLLRIAAIAALLSLGLVLADGAVSFATDLRSAHAARLP